MDTMILYRVGIVGQLEFVRDDDGDIAIFTSDASAEAYAERNQLFKSGQAEYQTVSVEI